MKEIGERYALLVKKGGIRENDRKAHERIHLMFGKAQNNLKLAKAVFEMSISAKIKDVLKLKESDSFFDWSIQAAYYAMFHAANALLATKRVKITSIDSHASALYAFGKHFILSGELAEELFVIYGQAEEKAMALFSSLAEEKEKRGFSAYQRLSRMNMEPAEESIEHASEFLRAIGDVLAKGNYI
ncbi:MAG: HEPN domain-containing protein [Nanoarchaeota archaeon]|nr:HEPN domain-containing protein [Nanoarchaeota archaeon]